MPMLNWHFTENWLITGLPYILAGCYIKRNIELFDNKKYIFICCICGFILICVNSIITYNVNIMPLAVALFSISLYITAQYKYKKYIFRNIELLGKKYSMYIYVIHIMVGQIIVSMTSRFNYQSNISEWSIPVMVMVLSILLSMGIYSINNKLIKKRVKKC